MVEKICKLTACSQCRFFQKVYNVKKGNIIKPIDKTDYEIYCTYWEEQSKEGRDLLVERFDYDTHEKLKKEIHKDCPLDNFDVLSDAVDLLDSIYGASEAMVIRERPPQRIVNMIKESDVRQRLDSAIGQWHPSHCPTKCRRG